MLRSARLSRFVIVALVALVALGAPSVRAADTLAPAGSPVATVGQLIVDQAAGRSRDEAVAADGGGANPFGIEEAALLAAAGAGRIRTDTGGAPVAPGELSILLDFSTPGGKFTPGPDTPPTIPFAFLRDGKCQAGYVTGFPAPSVIYLADLTGRPCNAAAVDARNLEAYALIQDALEKAPHDLGDADLELVVRAAYTAASAHARANGNYFARDGAFDPLRQAVAAEVARAGFVSVAVPATAAESLDAARACLAAPGTELRMAVNPFGDGLGLVAVSSTRVFAYRYDPHRSAEIVVTPPEDCLAASPSADASPASKDQTAG